MAAKAAIYGKPRTRNLPWVPAFAGMTRAPAEASTTWRAAMRTPKAVALSDTCNAWNSIFE
jgi:hypothetical protein